MFREDVEKIQCGFAKKTRCAKCEHRENCNLIEVIDAIISAHNTELERIAAGINSIVSEPRSAYGANCYMDGLIVAQAHVRKEKCQ